MSHKLRTTTLGKEDQFIRKLEQILAFRIKSHEVLNILKTFYCISLSSPSLSLSPTLSHSLCVCMLFGHLHVNVEENLWESVPSFHHVGLRNGTQVIRLGGSIFTMSQLDVPLTIFQ